MRSGLGPAVTCVGRIPKRHTAVIIAARRVLLDMVFIVRSLSRFKLKKRGLLFLLLHTLCGAAAGPCGAAESRFVSARAATVF